MRVRESWGRGVALLALVALCSLVSRVDASVVVSGTRVIYPADARDVSVALTNAGDTPSLVQVWIDRGDPDSTPESVEVPFLTTPPVTRINAHGGQAIRIAYLGEVAPVDHESVYWLNVLEVPANQAAPERNVLQLAYRTRIKLFYRPVGLAASPEQAAEQLYWELERGPGRWTLVARNESPYSVSLRRVGLGNEEHQVTARGSLIPAQSSRRFSIEPLATSQGFFDWINDYGVTQRRRFEL